MKLAIFLLLFLFCSGNVGASERNRDPGRLVEKTRVMMDEINRILRDFYNSIQDIQPTYGGEAKRYHDEVRPKPYSEPNKVTGGSLYHPDQKYHEQNMRMSYDLQDRYAVLHPRSQEIKRHFEEVKKLKEEWENRKNDRNAYQRYMEERARYMKELDAYNEDLKKHNEMRGRMGG